MSVPGSPEKAVGLRLSAQAATHLQRELNVVTKEDLRKLFKTIDSNGDGKVELHEFVQVCAMPAFGVHVVWV